MKNLDCATHVKTCGLKGLLADLALNADDDREKITEDAWAELLEQAEVNGDEFGDYDGPLTWS
jgi:hypothetical protein